MLNEKQALEKINAQSYRECLSDTGHDEDNYAECIYCEKIMTLFDTDNSGSLKTFFIASRYIRHDEDCPVLYARNRLNELKGKENP